MLAVAIAAPAADAGGPADALDRLVAASCVDCHDEFTDTGLDLSALGRDLGDAATFRHWERVLDRVEKGEMPPADADPADPALRENALAALARDLRTADLARRERIGRVPARRLTKAEYGHAVRDLLGIGGAVEVGLPDEGEAGSFDVVGSSQRLSALHVRALLAAADDALDRAVRLGPDPRVDRDIDLHGSRVLNEFHDKPVRLGGSVTRRLPVDSGGGVVLFRDADYLLNSGILGVGVPAAGTYRLSYRVEAFQADRPVPMKLIRKRPSGDATLLETVDLPPGDPRALTAEVHLEPGDVFYFTPNLSDAQTAALFAAGAKRYRGPGLALRSLSVAGPLEPTWPPPSTRDLLGDVTFERTNAGGFQAVPEGEPADAVRDVLTRFAPRAFRRPVSDAELAPFVALGEAALADGRPFADAVRVPLRALLTSPQFLMFGGEPGAPDDFALAERLAFFLTKSPPDGELTRLAAGGRLTDPAVLRRQTERLLDDPRSGRFVRDFLGQWLRLDEVNATSPNETLYPEYDELLGAAIPEEPVLVFRELVDRNLPASNLIASDFTFVNRRLAAHYGLTDVEGLHFRRVALAADSPRGGVLTTAAVLKTTANGTVTSPVVRGNFVLSNLLGTPPSPPPPGVGAVEPDTRGTTTIRELLDAHRDDASCAKCHAAIDPPGFALESFDPIGGFRTRYRANEPPSGVAAFFGAKETYGDGPAVDPSGVTADGKPFAEVRQFKRHLLADRETVAAHLLSRLVVYATGGEITFGDRDELAAMLDDTREGRFPVRDLIHAVVQSELFRRK